MFVLLDIRVRNVGHDGPLRLEIEGSVAHDLLLDGACEGVAPHPYWRALSILSG